jgi:predicted flavoprotein YhiN
MQNGMSVPMIRLEVEGMKTSIICALSEYTAQMDADIKKAVELACTPDRVKEVLYAAVGKELKNAIEDEIRNFFAYGNGRKAIKAAVEDKLTEEIERIEEYKKLQKRKGKKEK